MDNLTDFYPTPKTLIWKMTEGLSLDGSTQILEPSGGKGDICDHLKKKVEAARSYGSEEGTLPCRGK